MAYKHPFGTGASASRLPRIVFGISSVLLTAAGFCTSAHAQNTSNSVSLTLSGKKVTYNINSNWVAFQVKSSGSPETTIKGLSTQPAIDEDAPALRIGSDVVALRVENSASSASKKQLSNRLSSASSIQRHLRVFGSSSSPIIETTDAIVNFASNISDAQKKTLLQKQGAILVGAVGKWAPGAYRVRVSSANAYATNVANGLLQSGSAKWANPDLARRMQQRATTNDALFAKQWHLLNTGSNGGTAGTIGADVKATQAWDTTRGEGINICINDDGVDIDHEDLKGRFVKGMAFGDNSTDPRPSVDDDNHGTSVAGLALASGNNSIGVSGVAPNAGLIAVRIPLSSEEGIADSAIAQSLVWPVDNGADIVSCSWGPASDDDSQLSNLQNQAIEYVTTKGRGGKGAILLFAAGNDNTSAKSGLDTDPRIIHVAASNRLDKKSSYSNYGTMISFAAPGGYLNGDMVTTDRTGAKGYSTSSYNEGFNGTSAACPVAAGVAALVLSANPSLTRLQLLNVLTSTADKIDPGFGAYNESGFSKYYGYGRLNAFKAVQAASDLLGAKVAIVTPKAGKEYERGSLTANGTADDKTASVNVGLVKTDKFGKRTAYYNFTDSTWVTQQNSTGTVGMYAADFDDDANTWEKDLPELGGGYYALLAQGSTSESVNGPLVSSAFSVDLIDVNVTSPTVNGEYEAGTASGNLTSAIGTADGDASAVGVALIKKNASGQSVSQWDFNADIQTASNWVALNNETMMAKASLGLPEDGEVAWNLAMPSVLQPGKYELRVQGYDASSTAGDMQVVPFVVESNEGAPLNVALTPAKAKVAVGKVIAFKATYKHTVNFNKLTELQFRARMGDSISSPTIQVRYDMINKVVSIRNSTTGRWLNGYKPGTNVTIKSDFGDLNIRNCKVTLPTGKNAATSPVSFTVAITPRVSGVYSTELQASTKTLSTEWEAKGTLTVTASKSSKFNSFESRDAAEISIPSS